MKRYLGLFVVPHDLMGVSGRESKRILPLPLVWGKDKYPDDFGVAYLGEDNLPGEAVGVKLRTVTDVKQFEFEALKATAELLALPPGAPNPPRGARLEAAEAVLSSVSLSLAAMRDAGERRGTTWGEVAADLAQALADVRAGRVELAAEKRDWAAVNELADRYQELYRGDRATAARLSAARVAQAADLAAKDDAAGLERARGLLADYESREPGGKAPAAARARQLLAAKARAMLAKAQQLQGSDQAQARTLLATAERIDPGNADLGELRREIAGARPTLVVAARRRPVLMSPYAARFDSEKQVAGLLFEGLTEAIPDPEVGKRFVPQLASRLPAVVSGTREAELGTAAWSDPALGPVLASDVAGTLRLLKQIPQRESASVVGWLADRGLAGDDPLRARLRLDRGHPDPRELLTFKILPARWFAERNASPADEAFAKSPVGSGPYRLAKAGDDVLLTADPRYGSRDGNLGQPFIQDIRFADAGRFRDLAAELRAGRVNVLPDVPTIDLPKFTADNDLGGTVRVATAADPQRTWCLAINHRRPGLQSLELRRALTHAIDREAILRAVFRDPASPEKYHRAMTGPFPPTSWATPDGAAALFNRDLAASKARAYLKTPGAAPTLELVYPSDDAQAALACERIRQMVDELTADDALKLVLRPQPLPPDEFLARVRGQGRFDLAYWPRDGDDVWYPLELASDLDPAFATPGGRNVGGYLGERAGRSGPDIALGQLLAETRGVRDWSGRLKPLAERIHAAFNEAVPLVPLWELDRHTVLTRSVKIRFPGESSDADPSRLPPTTLFTAIGGWRLE